MYLNLILLNTSNFINGIQFFNDLLGSLEFVCFFNHSTENSTFGALIDILPNPTSIRIMILFSSVFQLDPSGHKSDKDTDRLE